MWVIEFIFKPKSLPLVEGLLLVAFTLSIFAWLFIKEYCYNAIRPILKSLCGHSPPVIKGFKYVGTCNGKYLFVSNKYFHPRDQYEFRNPRTWEIPYYVDIPFEYELKFLFRKKAISTTKACWFKKYITSDRQPDGAMIYGKRQFTIVPITIVYKGEQIIPVIRVEIK